MKRFLAVLICCCLTLASAAAAESLLMLAVRAIIPEYVSNLQVTETEQQLRITGTVASTDEVSEYMRLLAEKIQQPNLQSVKREGNTSIFVITLNK